MTPDPCLCWIEAVGRNCTLPRRHAGSHLPFPRWPRKDITRENPAARKAVTA